MSLPLATIAATAPVASACIAGVITAAVYFRPSCLCGRKVAQKTADSMKPATKPAALAAARTITALASKTAAAPLAQVTPSAPSAGAKAVAAVARPLLNETSDTDIKALVTKVFAQHVILSIREIACREAYQKLLLQNHGITYENYILVAPDNFLLAQSTIAAAIKDNRQFSDTFWSDLEKAVSLFAQKAKERTNVATQVGLDAFHSCIKKMVKVPDPVSNPQAAVAATPPAPAFASPTAAARPIAPKRARRAPAPEPYEEVRGIATRTRSKAAHRA